MSDDYEEDFLQKITNVSWATSQFVFTYSIATAATNAPPTVQGRVVLPNSLGQGDLTQRFTVASSYDKYLYNDPPKTKRKTTPGQSKPVWVIDTTIWYIFAGSANTGHQYYGCTAEIAVARFIENWEYYYGTIPPDLAESLHAVFYGDVLGYPPRPPNPAFFARSGNTAHQEVGQPSTTYSIDVSGSATINMSRVLASFKEPPAHVSFTLTSSATFNFAYTSKKNGKVIQRGTDDGLGPRTITVTVDPKTLRFTTA